MVAAALLLFTVLHIQLSISCVRHAVDLLLDGHLYFGLEVVERPLRVESP